MPQIFGLYVETSGDYILSIGDTIEQAVETARSCLDLSPDDPVLPWDHESADPVELLNSEYGGAAILTLDL